MGWIRLSDDYADHPKFAALSDGAFRLWHQGMCFCRKFKTDGIVPLVSLRTFHAYSPKRMRELMTPWKEGANALWHDIPGVGIRVHDFLDWNLSKEEEQDERTASAARMRKFRHARYGVTEGVTGGVTSGVTNRNVPVRSGIGREKKPPARSEGVQGKPSDPSEAVIGRVEAFIERFKAAYPKYRHGAHYVGKPALDYEPACRLLEAYQDDAYLDRLTVVYLTTDHEFAEGNTRTIGRFAALASWCDERLREHDAKKARTA